MIPETGIQSRNTNLLKPALSLHRSSFCKGMEPESRPDGGVSVSKVPTVHA